MDRVILNELLARVNTQPLKRADAPTVALVVFNTTDASTPPCRVRFTATFPTRAVKPVTVRDDRGTLVPSRIVSETTTYSPNLPQGTFLWSLVLEFVMPDGLPRRTGRAFAASYEAPPAITPVYESLPLRTDLLVYETTCHPGDLPAMFRLPDDDAAD